MIAVEAVKTDSQLKQLERILLEHVNGRLYLDIWKLGVNVALRISDMLLLTMDQVKGIDPDRLQFTIVEKKTRKTRVLTFNKGAMNIVRRRLQEHQNDVWLFQSPLPLQSKMKAKPTSRRSVALAFSNAGKRLNPCSRLRAVGQFLKN